MKVFEGVMDDVRATKLQVKMIILYFHTVVPLAQFRVHHVNHEII